MQPPLTQHINRYRQRKTDAKTIEQQLVVEDRMIESSEDSGQPCSRRKRRTEIASEVESVIFSRTMVSPIPGSDLDRGPNSGPHRSKRMANPCYALPSLEHHAQDCFGSFRQETIRLSQTIASASQPL